MIDGGDLDLNSVYSCTDSLKHRLKEMMLNQELVFMRQVYELHQLYRMQLATMEDFKRKGFDNYNFDTGGSKSISKNKNTQAQCLTHEQHRLSGFMHKPLYVHLPADEFISHCVDDCTGKEPLRNALKESIESNNLSRGVIVSDLDNLNLSLSIGQDADKKVIDHRSWKANKTCASSLDVIDLEDPLFRFSRNDARLGLASGCGMNDVFNGFPTRKAFLDIGPSFQGQTSSDSGFNGHNRELLYVDLLRKNQTSGTCKANNLDLNMVQLEDSSYFLNYYSIVENPARTSFSGISDKAYPKSIIPSSACPTAWKKANVNLCTESSDTHQQFDLNLDLLPSFIDLDSDSGEDLCSSQSNPKFESMDSSLKLSNCMSCDIDMVDAVETEAIIEREAEPVASSESEFIIDHQSSSLNTMQSVAKYGGFNFSSCKVSQTSPLADQKSSDSTESNIQSNNNNNNNNPVESGKNGVRESNVECTNREVDEMVQTAAELLVQISLVTQFQDKDGEQPQCSLESYEVMVLNAKESDPDDYYCVSSNAFEVEESKNKESSRYKLKRGTRMKDFQKDVLPSMSILSRQEIREDINIMESVIRSREYRKMRAKMGDNSGDWFRPSRSKRSRLCFSRRHYP